MIRKAIIVTLVVLTLCTVLASVASYGQPLTKNFMWDDPSVTVAIRSASLIITKLNNPPNIMPATGVLMPRSFTRLANEQGERNLFRLPKLQYHYFQNGQSGWVNLVIPLWLLFVIFSLYPTIAFIRGPLRRWRRRRKGLCLKCGYDLTGNESGVCPECGTGVVEIPCHR